MENMMAWFRFHQNNSGGSHDIDHKKGIGPNVWVEADTPEEANEYAKSIGVYFDGVEKELDCECCGDRWYPVQDHDKIDEYEIRREYDFFFHNYVYLHHKNKHKRTIERVTNAK
jgi:hypothetical protein